MNLINVKETGALVDILYIFSPPKEKNMISKTVLKVNAAFLHDPTNAWRIHMAENL